MRKIMLTVLMLHTLAAIAQPNKTYNLDLEQLDSRTGLPAGWGLGNIKDAGIPKDSTANAYRIDPGIKHSGKSSLLIDWSKGYDEWTATNYRINQTFKGSVIKLKGYLKTETVTQGAGLWMRLEGKDQQVLGFDNMMSRAVKGTTDWTEYTVELEYNKEEVTSIVIGGLVTGTGKVWMDDLRVLIDDKDISVAETYTPKGDKADETTEFENGSGIAQIRLDKDKVKTLANLGMLWGFIKYYHAEVNKGNFNMDAALFHILPKILKANTEAAAGKIMEEWVDGFGKPKLCPKCEDFKQTDNTKLAPDYGNLFDKGNLPASLVEKLSYIRKNRYYADEHYYVASTRVGNPAFKHEKPYADQLYPDAGMRLLALYRYWNMIQYFFPDRHLIGKDWNTALPEFLPEFCEAQDTAAYQLACLKLIASIHDTHANIWGGGDKLREVKGEYIVPFSAKFIENKLVITGYYKDTLNIKELVKPGDIVEAIDGVPVDELVTRYLPVTPASNYETQLRDIRKARGALLRSSKSVATVTINRNGQKSNVTVNKNKVSAAEVWADMDTVAKHTAYALLKDNIGYIYPAKLAEKDIQKVKDLFENAAGLVIDMRCYPTTFMPFTYGDWLKPRAGKFVTFTIPSIDIPGSFEYQEGPSNGGGGRNHFNGKIVIIVNAETQSQAEYTTMALYTAPDVKVIGSQTAGADGNVSDIVLPGGIRTMISGIGILYPDRTETQRAGVKIDKVVKPTIRGFTEGRDELLEEAIRMIKG